MTTPSSGASSGLTTQLRTLATQIENSSDLGYTPSTNSKGTIVAISNGPPVTVSVQMSGDDTVTVDGVRLLDGVSPQVGNTVILEKQGSQVFVKGTISATNGLTVGNSDGWNRASLAAGSHGGNANGDVYYRRTLVSGSWRMEWRGGWSPSGFQLLASPLDIPYRPTTKRSVFATRDVQGGSNIIQFDFKTDGTAEMIGAGTTPLSAGGNLDTDYVDPIDNTTAGGADGHIHGVVGSHNHYAGYWGHTHNVNYPTWVGFNMTYYYL